MDDELAKAREAVAAAGLDVGHLSQDRFLWAMAIAFSRAFPLPPKGGASDGSGAGLEPTLVPLLDFLHHDFGRTTCDVRVRERGSRYHPLVLCCIARAPLPASGRERGAVEGRGEEERYASVLSLFPRGSGRETARKGPGGLRGNGVLQ